MVFPKSTNTILSILFFAFMILLMNCFMGNYEAVVLSDFTAYAIIGERYANCDWNKAINAAWAPGISWLLAIGFKVGISKAMIGITWLYFQAIILAFTYLMLVNKFVENHIHRMLWLLVCSPAIIYFSLLYPSADIVVGCIYLYFFFYLDTISLNSKWTFREALFLATISAIAYLFKYFSLPFCIILTGVFLVYYSYKNPLSFKNCLKFYLIFLVSTSLLVSPWVILLSNKYNQFTVSTSQLYPHVFNHPDYIGIKLEEVTGLIAPPYNDSPTSWEDPTFYPYPKWSPFDGVDMFKHSLTRFNLYFSLAMRYGIGYCSVLAWFIIGYSLWSIYKREAYYNLQIIILLAMLLYSIGYSMYLFDERHYTWFYFALVWLVLLSYKPNKLLLRFWVFIAAITFMRMPIINYWIYNKINKTNKEVLEAIYEIPESMIIGQKISTNYDNFAMCLAWRRNAYSYGIPTPKFANANCKKYEANLYIMFRGHKEIDLNLQSKIWESKNHQLEIFIIE
jgi:hypothetical protein